MTWKPGGQSGQIGEEDTHVWRVQLNTTHVNTVDLQRVLAPEELSRAGKFHRELDRRRYQITRFALRDILSKYCGDNAERIEFDYNSFGKPLLPAEQGLRFNVSHAGEVSLIGIARAREVGVDVERIQGDPSDPAALIRIAKRFFSPNEVIRLLELPEAALPRSFFTCWTRKEAFIKAKGLGLSIPLDSFEVAFLPDDMPELLVYQDDPSEKDHWSIFHLEPAPDYVGALVVEGERPELTCWSWMS